MRPNRRYSRAGDRMRWRLNPSKGRRLPGAVSFRVKAVSLSTRERQTKSSKPRAGALGKAGARGLQLGGRAREPRAADVVVAGSRGEIPRAEAVGGKAAHQPRPAEECLEDRHALAAEPRHVVGLDAAHRDDVAEH